MARRRERIPGIQKGDCGASFVHNDVKSYYTSMRGLGYYRGVLGQKRVENVLSFFFFLTRY